MQGIEATLVALGFKKHFMVQGRARIRDLFRSGACGIYVLHFQNGEYLLGETEDVIQAFAEHAKDYYDIQQISFKAARPESLSVEYKRAKKYLEAEGWKMRDPVGIVDLDDAASDQTFYEVKVGTRTVEVARLPEEVVVFDNEPPPEEEQPFVEEQTVYEHQPIYTENLLDDIIPREVQFRWLEDMDFDDLEGERQDNIALRRRYHMQYVKLLMHPDIDAIIAALGVYVTSTIPSPRRTEMSYWSAVCVTGGDMQPVIHLNVGGQMTVEVKFYGDRTLFWVFLTRELLNQILPFSVDDVDDKMSLHMLSDWKIEDADHELEIGIQTCSLKVGGEDQLGVVVVNPYDMMRLTLFLQPVMRFFNFGLMQKGYCPTGENHCLDLADRLFLDPTSSDTNESLESY